MPRAEELQGAGTLSFFCPWWGFQMKHRHTNQAYPLSFYPDVLWQRLLAPLGWPRAVCHSQALEKLLCAAAAPQETGRMARNKRNLLQGSRSQPTPGTSGRLRKKSLVLLPELNQASKGLTVQYWGSWGASLLPPSSAPTLCAPTSMTPFDH